MEIGFLLDHTYNAVLPAIWVAGPPEKKKFWYGGSRFIVKEKRWHQVETWRCTACGYLDSYTKMLPRLLE